jgi:two-component system, response regulator, stage 0 sporulation protein F
MVLCDVHMPVMNGLQTVRILKQSRPEIPVIMTDSFPDKEMEEALKSGATHCLAKPFDLEDLRATVGKIIKGRIVTKT